VILPKIVSLVLEIDQKPQNVQLVLKTTLTIKNLLKVKSVALDIINVLNVTMKPVLFVKITGNFLIVLVLQDILELRKNVNIGITDV